LDRNEKFHFWNVLSPEYYKAEDSIPTSKHVPVGDIEKLLPELNIGKNEEIVTYCASFDCSASKKAAEKLVQAGYTNVSAYEGGIKDWKEGGLPTGQGKSQGGGCACG